MSVQAMSDAWTNSPYTGDTLLVQLAIADVVNDVYENRCWMLRPELAAKARCDVSTVTRALGRMKQDGYLEVLVAGGGRGKPTEYRYHVGAWKARRQPDGSLSYVRWEPAQDEPVLETETGASCDETGSGARVRPISTQGTQDRLVEPSPEPSASVAGPSSDAWRLARERLARGRIVDRGPRRLAVVAQAALDAGHSVEIVERALGSLVGVPIEVGNLTVACSQATRDRTATNRTADESDAGPWWETAEARGSTW